MEIQLNRDKSMVADAYSLHVMENDVKTVLERFAGRLSKRQAVCDRSPACSPSARDGERYRSDWPEGGAKRIDEVT